MTNSKTTSATKAEASKERRKEEITKEISLQRREKRDYSVLAVLNVSARRHQNVATVRTRPTSYYDEETKSTKYNASYLNCPEAEKKTWNTEETNNIGYCYQNRIGGEKEGNKAFIYYKNFLGVRDTIGHISYQFESGIEKDEHRNFFYYQKFAEMENIARTSKI
ncbi:hypothetical protein C2G38_2184712 [Gigaspora rosea]|uniref:Uncharacterized protein n=1 Tax=Gigaspora rosea TaxID=44941 RepID=A0A397VBS4_9GLOM|nr:hypothetical protein C2G38_2184712 [Gigaspora rosea]